MTRSVHPLRRIDRGIFSADPGAGEKAEQHEAAQIPRESGRCRRKEIDQDRDAEEPLAAKPVGQPAEEQRTENRAGEIGAVGKSDIGRRELQHTAFAQRACHRSRQRDLEAIKDPGDAERSDNKPVEAPPWQPVETGRYIGADDVRAHPWLAQPASPSRPDTLELSASCEALRLLLRQPVYQPGQAEGGGTSPKRPQIHPRKPLRLLLRPRRASALAGAGTAEWKQPAPQPQPTMPRHNPRPGRQVRRPRADRCRPSA